MIKPTVASNSDLQDHVQKTIVQGVHGINAADISGVYKNYRASAYANAAQENLVDATLTKVTLGSESYDPNSNLTGSRYTAPVAGYYSIKAGILFNNVVADKRYDAFVRKNAALTIILLGYAQASVAGLLSVPLNDSVYLAAGDYIELWARSNSGDNTVDIHGLAGGNCYTFMTVVFEGP